MTELKLPKSRPLETPALSEYLYKHFMKVAIVLSPKEGSLVLNMVLTQALC